MLTLVVKRNKEKRIKQGHPWIYTDDITNISAAVVAQDGDEFVAVTERMVPLGVGYISKSEKIAGYVIGSGCEQPIAALIEKALIKAISKRGDSRYCRLINSEGDRLGGVVADRYGEIIAVHFRNPGIEVYKNQILKLLTDKLGVDNFMVKNCDADWQFVNMQPAIIEIQENGIKYAIDLRKFQKTGFYYDQKENRALFASFAKDKKVLDCFCYHGGFGINALKNGAEVVEFVDSSQDALEACRNNCMVNEVYSRANFSHGDAFEILQNMLDREHKFGLISLDPPPFTKSVRDKKSALRAHYKLINMMVQLLEDGGVGFYSTCSNHIAMSDLVGIASKLKNVKIKERLGHPKDHPLLDVFKEGRYLNTIVVEKCKL